MDFGEKLSALRKQNGFSQETLAERLGVSRQAVSKWERNEAQPELSKILALCELFEVTPNELLGYEKKAEQAMVQGIGTGAFWLVVGCMGFVLLMLTSNVILGWSITLIGMCAAYYEISGKGSFFRWLKKALKWYFDTLFKDGNAL